MKYTKLYKKNNNGKILVWGIAREGNALHIGRGELGGKIQHTREVISHVTNVGKKNQTSPVTQAEKEKQSRIQKKLKSGYVRDLESAKNGEFDSVIKGGWLPMLAQSIEGNEKNIKYPCAIQPKLDGIRACYSNGKLYSRTRKEITSANHILTLLKNLPSLKYDGELYNHDLAKDFETIVSGVTTKKATSKSKLIQYHIYDINIERPFKDRMDILNQIAKTNTCDHIKFVPTKIISNLSMAQVTYENFLEDNYEGAMLRDLNSMYESGKRTKSLLKMKLFQDDEFKIVGFVEGKGKLANKVGKFVLQMRDGKEFNCKLKTTEKTLETMFKLGESKFIGKMMTVTFQGFTKKNGLPRQPIGKAIRGMRY